MDAVGIIIAYGLIISMPAMKTVKAKPIKILVVENDADMLNALNIALGSLGFDVDVLQNGKSILQHQFVLPDLFLLDNQLPVVDGLEICRYLKSKPNYRDVPIIVISENPAIKEKALAAGASNFIAKPFDVQELLEMIKNTLEMHTHPMR